MTSYVVLWVIVNVVFSFDQYTCPCELHYLSVIFIENIDINVYFIDIVNDMNV